MNVSAIAHGLSQNAAVPSSQDVPSRIEGLLRKRGPLPSLTTLKIKISGSDYDSDTESCLMVDSSGRFWRQGEANSATTGFDGSESWVQEPTGFSRPQAFSDRDISVFLAWLRSGQWLDHIGVTQLAILSDESDERLTVFSVQHSRAISRIGVDNETGLVQWFKFQGVQGEVKVSFSRYESHFGILLPRAVQAESALGSYQSEVTAIELVTVGVDFGKPIQRDPQVRFDADISPNLNVRRTPTGHVVIDVVVDHRGPLGFIFDTGAGATVIDSSMAEEMGLERIGEQALGSIFGTANTSVFRCATIQAGPLTLEEPRLVSMDLGAIREMLGDESIVGIIGYDLLCQCVCEIELARDEIRLFSEPPYTTAHAARNQWQKLTWLQNVPLVSGRFPRGDGIFRMDVGAAAGPAGNVIFHTPTVKRCQIETDGLQTVKSGEAEFAVGQIDWFELGSYRFERPMVLFSLAPSGPLAEANIDGNLGVEFLKVFRLVLDYRNERMAMVPIN